MTRLLMCCCIPFFILICEAGLINCSIVIGIDLGTAYTSVGIYRNEQVIIIPNDHGNTATPSCVAFLPSGEILIGEEAIKQSMYNPKNTIYNIKRIIGRKWNDELVQRDMKLYPFHVFDRKQKPYIRIISRDTIEILSPEEITAMILGKMKEIAEEYIGEEIVDAVITTPAYFNEDQRQATKHAGELAGLNIKRILSEPTAAALSHGLFDIETEKNILVYDLGGGTFDVSVVTCDNGVFRVLGTVGNPDLGGEDFNRNAINFILQKIQEKFPIGEMPASGYPFIQKLREEVEFAKRKLSYEQWVLIEIENLYKNNDFRMTFTRFQFEEMNKEYYETTLELVKKALEYSKLDKGNIDDIVLVGGSSKMPKVKTMLAAYFNGKIPNESTNPEDAVVRGAAIEAGVLANEESTKNIVLVDVYPFSLGCEDKQKSMWTVIPRNHVIPIQKTVKASTAYHSQTNIGLKIFRGDYMKTEKNVFLGELALYKIPKAPKGEPIIDISFEINKDGILNVTAREATTGNFEEIVIDSVYNKLSFEELQDIKWRLQTRKHKNKQRQYYKKAKIDFENMLFMIDHCVDQTDKWIERNLNNDHNDFMYPMKELFECVCIAKYGYSHDETKSCFVMKSPTKREVIKTKYFLNYANKKVMNWFNTHSEPSLELLIQHQEEIQEYTDFLLFGEYRKRTKPK